MIGEAEGQLVERLREERQPVVPTEAEVVAGPHLWFLVCGNLDVYPNVVDMNMTTPWRLGNLESDGIEAVLNAFTEDRTPGQQTMRTVPVGELASRYGNLQSCRLYCEVDLKSLWLAKHLENALAR